MPGWISRDRLFSCLMNMNSRRPVRAGGEAGESIPEIELSMRSERMVSLKLSSIFLVVSW